MSEGDWASEAFGDTSNLGDTFDPDASSENDNSNENDNRQDAPLTPTIPVENMPVPMFNVPTVDDAIKSGMENPAGYTPVTNENGEVIRYEKTDDDGKKRTSFPGLPNVSYTDEEIPEALRKEMMKPDLMQKINDYASKVAKSAPAVAGVAAATGNLPVAIGAGIVAGLGTLVEIFTRPDLTPAQKNEKINEEINKMTPEERAETLAGLTKITQPSPSEPSAPSSPSEVNDHGSNVMEEQTQPSSISAIMSSIKNAIPPVTTPAAASTTEEQARIAALVKSYNPYANQAQYQPIDISTASSPIQAEAIKKYNDLIAASAKSEALAADATRGIIGATKLSADNRDAWKQYFNPADYKATATQATAAQSGYVPVSPASLITGNYQGDVSRLGEYNANIAQSSERASALEAMNMAKQRALGVTPSVAENSYLQNLDKLIKSQAAAAAGVRGPGSALAQEAAARGAAALGQQAVRETAGLRLQEQQAAEQLYASQANQLMIEDQKLNAQAKTNELNQLVNLTQANLENAKARLESDKFNADAINAVNKLDAQLRTQTANLNAQLQNNVNLQNASEANRVSIQNAVQALEASKYAGSSAQAALQAQIGLERADIERMYGYNKDAVEALTQNLSKAASGITGAAASDLAERQFKENIRRYDTNRNDTLDANEAAQESAETGVYLRAGLEGLKILQDYNKEAPSTGESYSDWLKRKGYNK